MIMETRSKRKQSVEITSEIEMTVLPRRSEEEEIDEKEGQEEEYIDEEEGEEGEEEEEPYIHKRERNIARNEEFLQGLGIGLVVKDLGAHTAVPPNIKRAKAAADVQSVRIMPPRVKFSRTTANDEITQVRTSLACTLCDQYATSMSLPVEAEKALFIHQQSVNCKNQFADKSLPTYLQSFVVHSRSKVNRGYDLSACFETFLTLSVQVTSNRSTKRSWVLYTRQHSVRLFHPSFGKRPKCKVFE